MTEETKAPVKTHNDPIPSAFAEHQSKMPEPPAEVDREATPLVKLDAPIGSKYVPFYDIKFPKDVDPARWLKDKGIVPIRRYVCELIGHPEFKALGSWAMCSTDAIVNFEQHYQIQPSARLRYSVIEVPPPKSEDTKPSVKDESKQNADDAKAKELASANNAGASTR